MLSVTKKASISVIAARFGGLMISVVAVGSLGMGCGSSSGSANHDGAAASGGTVGSAGAGGVAGVTGAAGAGGTSATGKGGTTGKAGTTGTAGASGAFADIGKACTSNVDCTGGTTCITESSKSFDMEGPANGICTVDCSMNGHSDCGSSASCVSFTNSQSGPAYCLETCKLGGAQSASKCHGRPDVACATFQDADPTMNLPQIDLCAPICSQDSDCPGRKCDFKTGFCSDTAPTGDPLGTHCVVNADGGASTCAGGCLPVGPAAGGTNIAATYCSMACVFGNLDACNSAGVGGSLMSGGVHGVCALSGANPAAGDLGFCVQECDTAADCTDKTDKAGSCDTTIMSATGHGFCSW